MMRRLSSVACAVLVVLACSACAARRFDTLMQTWKGHTIEDLFTTWGPPSFLYSDGQRGRVVVYVPAPVPNVKRESDRAPLPVYSPALTAGLPIVRIFFVNPAGRIERSEWRGRWECCSLDSKSTDDGPPRRAPELPTAPMRPQSPVSL